MVKSVVVLIGLLTVIARAEAVSEDALESVAKGNLLFSKEVYEVISKKTTGNVFISPVSVEVVLALAHAGARGETARQIAAALHLPEDSRVVQVGFHALMSSLESSKNMTLEIANKIFIEDRYELLEEYKSIAEKGFLSRVQEIDFRDPMDAARKINSWVEQKTKNKIKNLVSPDMFSGLTRLVLVNAIYFKGLWKNTFPKQFTAPKDFFISSTQKKKVPMMLHKAFFGYANLEELDATGLEIPYQDGSLSMIILLPNETDGISKLESKLRDVNFGEILEKFIIQEVVVTIPKFKLEETTDFNDILMEMGMTDMFDARAADFSGISGSKDLYVSQVKQKAFIEVNEEGSEAAAATVGLEPKALLPVPPERFKVDHPFIFAIQEKKTGAILFMGRVAEPNY